MSANITDWLKFSQNRKIGTTNATNRWQLDRTQESVAGGGDHLQEVEIYQNILLYILYVLQQVQLPYSQPPHYRGEEYLLLATF